MYVEKPALVVTPSTKKDGVDIINYAKAQDLKAMPACGGHSNFVPIDGKTIYVDMKKTDNTPLDKDTSTIELGGGIIACQFGKYITMEGYCTGWPTSIAVGTAGLTVGCGMVSRWAVHERGAAEIDQ